MPYLSSDSDGSDSIEPDETYGGVEVTIRKLSSTSASHEEQYLYHYIAGKLMDDDQDDDEESPMIETTPVESSKLFHFINSRCIKDFQKAGASHDKIGKLLSEGPSFIVTDKCLQVGELCDSVPTIFPEIVTNEETGRQAFEYVHPESKDTKICIHEPRSPPKAEYSGGKKTVTSSIVKHKVCISSAKS